MTNPITELTSALRNKTAEQRRNLKKKEQTIKEAEATVKSDADQREEIERKRLSAIAGAVQEDPAVLKVKAELERLHVRFMRARNRNENQLREKVLNAMRDHAVNAFLLGDEKEGLKEWGKYKIALEEKEFLELIIGRQAGAEERMKLQINGAEIQARRRLE